MTDKTKEKPHYHGHRARLRERFLRDNGASMADYELLELLIALALPRVDTKPIAKALIARFGSFAKVAAADPADLLTVHGIGDSSVIPIKLIQAASLRLLREEVGQQPVIASWDRLLDYLKAAMGRENREQLRILFLDNRNRLIADEVQHRGTINHTPAYPREIVRRALELYAAAIILVHNHPSGDPTPSRDDINLTHQVREAADNLGIKLHDHIVVGRDDTLSFKSAGLL